MNLGENFLDKVESGPESPYLGPDLQILVLFLIRIILILIRTTSGLEKGILRYLALNVREGAFWIALHWRKF